MKNRNPRIWVPEVRKAAVDAAEALEEKIDAAEITAPVGRSRYGPVVVRAIPPKLFSGPFQKNARLDDVFWR